MRENVAICETPDMKTALNNEIFYDKHSDEDAGIMDNLLNDMDKKTAIVASVGGVVLVFLLIAIAIAIKRQAHSDFNRSILTSGNESSIDTDTEDERDEDGDIECTVFDVDDEEKEAPKPYKDVDDDSDDEGVDLEEGIFVNARG